MISIKEVSLKEVDVMIRTCFEGEEKADENLKAVMAAGAFTGKEGELFVLPQITDEVKYFFYLGLGKREAFNGDILRKGIAQCVKRAADLKVKKVAVEIAVCDRLCAGGNVKAVTEGIILGSYEFKRRQNEEKKPETVFYITGVPKEKTERAKILLREHENVAQGVVIARDLTNEPSNILYPKTLAERVYALGKEAGFETEVMEEEAVRALGMEAFLAVGGSSQKKPELIVMRYKGGEADDETLGLVGKGLTYDTGGYSLKSNAGMVTMHSDMAGAAAVIGTMYAVSKNKVRKNVTAVVAACENVISAGSYKPGDIINSMSGKTIEIGNTDAEGRLTLADAVTYMIEKEKADRIIDVATLTGAAIHALGTDVTAVVTNDEAFYRQLQAASDKTGEQFWQLPAFKEYRQMNKSEVADLKNVGGKNAGAITAGLFVGEFVQDKPWLHLDIAGTSWADKASGYQSKGGTGVPVRTLYGMLAAPCPCHGKHK